MKKINHRFFDILKECMKYERFDAFQDGEKFVKSRFVRTLKEGHPFIFDRKTSEEAFENCSQYAPLEDRIDNLIKIRDVETQLTSIAEAFSLPFANSIYIITDPIMISVRPQDGGRAFNCRIHGYIIEEIKPAEEFLVYVVVERSDIPVKNIKKTPPMIAVIDNFRIDLKNLKAVHSTEEALLICNLTTMISVKRIGIEHNGTETIKTKGLGLGVTALKYDNIMHVANKVEYDYTRSALGGEIEWLRIGWWRAHWRALYYSEDVTDSFGRRVVDYTRIGKNRAGDYNVPGYTWVNEHTKGDKELVEIRTRTVKHG